MDYVFSLCARISSHVTGILERTLAGDSTTVHHQPNPGMGGSSSGAQGPINTATSPSWIERSIQVAFPQSVYYFGRPAAPQVAGDAPGGLPHFLGPPPPYTSREPLPSYAHAIGQNASGTFIGSIMGIFRARFPTLPINGAIIFRTPPPTLVPQNNRHRRRLQRLNGRWRSVSIAVISVVVVSAVVVLAIELIGAYNKSRASSTHH